VGVLDVDEQRAGDAIVAAGNVLEGRQHAAHFSAFDLVEVFFQERKTEDAKGRRAGIEPLDDQIVVLARLDEGTVFPHGGANGFHPIFFKGRDGLEFLAAFFHHQLDEGIARAGRRGRAQNFDGRIGERRVDFRPVGVGIGNDFAVNFDFLGQRREQLGLGDRHFRTVIRIGQDDTVKADDHFRNVRDAICGAVFFLTVLDGPRGAGEVGMLLADTATEKFHTAAGARRFDDRSRTAADLGKAFDNRRGEGENGGRADNADCIACLRRGCDTHAGQRRHGERHFLLHH